MSGSPRTETVPTRSDAMDKSELIVHGGRVIDPASGIDVAYDVAVKTDVSILAIDEGDWMPQDSLGVRIQTDKRLRPVLALRAGKMHRSRSPLLDDQAQRRRDGALPLPVPGPLRTTLAEIAHIYQFSATILQTLCLLMG